MALININFALLQLFVEEPGAAITMSASQSLKQTSVLLLSNPWQAAEGSALSCVLVEVALCVRELAMPPCGRFLDEIISNCLHFSLPRINRRGLNAPTDEGKHLFSKTIPFPFGYLFLKARERRGDNSAL